jgi:hypothetical protein
LWLWRFRCRRLLASAAEPPPEDCAAGDGDGAGDEGRADEGAAAAAAPAGDSLSRDAATANFFLGLRRSADDSVIPDEERTSELETLMEPLVGERAADPGETGAADAAAPASDAAAADAEPSPPPPPPPPPPPAVPRDLRRDFFRFPLP